MQKLIALAFFALLVIVVGRRVGSVLEAQQLGAAQQIDHAVANNLR